MKIEEYVGGLNVILEVEYGAVLQYLLHTYRFSRMGQKKLANELMVFVNDETRHAEALAEKIKELGGKPTKTARWNQSANDIETMLKINLASEKESIKIYEKLIKDADTQRFKGLKTLLEEQLADEIKHTKLLQKYLAK